MWPDKVVDFFMPAGNGHFSKWTLSKSELSGPQVIPSGYIKIHEA